MTTFVDAGSLRRAISRIVGDLLEALGRFDPLLDHVEDHVAGRAHLVHAADDLTDG